MKTLLTILFLLVIKIGLTQEFKIPNSSNAVWFLNDEAYCDICPSNYLSRQYIDGDTIINNESYFKLFNLNLGQYIQNDVCSFFCVKKSSSIKYLGAINTFDKKVNFYQSGDTVKTTLFDFSLEVGDSLTVQTHESGDKLGYYVTSVDSVEIMDSKRLRFNVVNYNGVTSNWIEGIGSLNGLLSYDQGWEYDERDILCYHENDQIVYERTEECANCSYILANNSFSSAPSFSIYPNPMTDIAICHFNQNIKPISYRIFDLGGNVIDNSLLRGPTELTLRKEDIGSGIFVIEITDHKNFKYSQKLIIK